MHGLVLPLGALEHLVLAGVRVGGQVAHVGDVHHPVHLVARVAQVLLQHVLHDVAAQVADVGEVVHRGAAGVHLHLAGGVGHKFLFFVGKRELYSSILSHPFPGINPGLFTTGSPRACSNSCRRFSKRSSSAAAGGTAPSSTGSATWIWSTSSQGWRGGLRAPSPR